MAVDLRALVPEPTGIGVYTQALLTALARRGGARYLGVSHRPPRPAAELAGEGVALEHQAAPLGVLWQQLRLPARLARGDVDLLWSPLSTLPVRCPVPGVVTVHDLTALLLPETHSLKVRLSLLPFLRRTAATAAVVVADSHSTARDMERLFPECAGRLRVVPLGVDPGFRPGEPAAVAATREELGCPEGYLLYVGTLEPRKNVDGLLDAWEALRRRRPETPPLVLAGGSGWRNKRLRRRIARLAGHGVVALGRVERPRLVRLFQAARVFLYPSLYEGFGLPPLEAMACGVPVVASRSSSLPEVVGNAGLLVAPQDAEALARATQRLLEDGELAASLAAAGRARARGFTWEAAAERMEGIFLEVLAGRGRG